MHSSHLNITHSGSPGAKGFYRTSLVIAGVGVVLFTSGLVPQIPLWVYFFSSAILWFIGMGKEMFASREEAATSAPLSPPLASAPVKATPSAPPRSEVEELLDQLIREQTNATQQMKKDSAIWPVLQESFNNTAPKGKSLEITQADLSTLPSLLIAALHSHAASVPSLPAEDPSFRARKDSYYVVAP